MYHLAYLTALWYSLVFHLIASGHQTFPVELISFIYPAYHFFPLYSFILNYSNQSTLKQSKDSLKIFRTPKYMYLQFTSVQKLFLSCFFFSWETKRVPATDELRLDGHDITAKRIISLEIFSCFLNISYPSLSLKSLRRFVINIMHLEAKYCFYLIEMKFNLFLKYCCLAHDQNILCSAKVFHLSTRLDPQMKAIQMKWVPFIQQLLQKCQKLLIFIVLSLRQIGWQRYSSIAFLHSRHEDSSSHTAEGKTLRTILLGPDYMASTGWNFKLAITWRRIQPGSQ